MQDYPPVADRGREQNRSEHSHTHENNVSLWIAAATIIISLAVLLMFSQEKLHNGGAPFVITPPSQISSASADRL